MFFIIASGIQVLFFVFIFIAFYTDKHKDNSYLQKVTSHRPVSIIVCAYNEVHNLKQLLPLLYQQNYLHKEIIIVDDQSTDGTKDLLNKEMLLHEELVIVSVNDSEGIPGKKKALEIGILKAKHEIILLTDADCLPNSDLWVHSMSKYFEDEKVKIVLGYAPYLKQKGLLNAFIQYETFHTAIMYISAAFLGFPYMGIGRNMAYRKSLFLHNNGFNNHASVLSGDDDLFVNKHANSKNTRVVLERHAQVQSIPQKSWKSFLNQKHRHLEAGKYYKFSDKIWLGTAVLSHLFFWICFCILLLNKFSSPYIFLSIFLIRIICLIIVYKYVGLKLNDRINLKSLVFLDFLFVIYYTITGIRAFFFKKKQWK